MVKAKNLFKDSGYILVRSVTSQLELSLSLHTSLVEKKPSHVSCVHPESVSQSQWQNKFKCSCNP